MDPKHTQISHVDRTGDKIHIRVTRRPYANAAVGFRVNGMTKWVRRRAYENYVDLSNHLCITVRDSVCSTLFTFMKKPK